MYSVLICQFESTFGGQTKSNRNVIVQICLNPENFLNFGCKERFRY